MNPLSRFRSYRLMPIISLGLVLATVAGIFALSILADRAAESRRDRIAEETGPLSLALERVDTGVFRLAAEVRAFAATESTVLRLRYRDARAYLFAALDDLSNSRADDPELVRELEVTSASARAYLITAERIAATVPTNPAEAERLIVEEGTPQLDVFLAAKEIARTSIGKQVEEAQDEIRRIEGIERIALVVGGVVLVGVAVLLFRLVLANRRMADESGIERARLVAILDTIDYGVYQTDVHGAIRLANPASETLTGYLLRDVIGRDLHRALPHTDGEGNSCTKESCPWISVAVASGEVNRGTSLLSRKDGSPMPVEIGTAPILASGWPVGRVIVFQEISERLRQDAMKDDFLGFASHELRSPLTTVYGWSRWLADRAAKAPEAFDEDTTEAIQTLESETLRMRHIIELFLDLTRIQMDRLELNQQTVDIAELVHDETVALQERHPEVVVDASYPPRAPVMEIDGDRLRQMMVNLLENAVKYGGTPSTVSIRMESKGGHVSISVSDNGAGIPAGDQDRIFERFYRGESAAAGKGLGIGLFVTSELVRRMDGTVTCRNLPESGAEFTITLPS